MPFDLSSAKPIESSGFDLSSAKPVEEQSGYQKAIALMKNRGMEIPKTSPEDIAKANKSAGRAALTLVAGIPGSIVSGLAGAESLVESAGASFLGKKGITIDTSLAEAQKAMEKVNSKIDFTKTDPEKKAVEMVGNVMMYPFKKTGEGLAGLTELVSTGDLRKASDVITGKSTGSNIAVPIVETIGEVGAMLLMPEAIKSGKGLAKNLKEFVKNPSSKPPWIETPREFQTSPFLSRETPMRSIIPPKPHDAIATTEQVKIEPPKERTHNAPNIANEAPIVPVVETIAKETPVRMTSLEETVKKMATEAITDESYALKLMADEIRNTSGVEKGTLGGETSHNIGSSNPQWFKDLNSTLKKQGKLNKGISREDFFDIVEKVNEKSTASLTEKQSEIYDYMTMAADKFKSEHTEFKEIADLKWMEDNGYEPMGGSKIVAADLAVGDKVLVKGEEFEFKRTNKEGNIILKDGKEVELDPFDSIIIDGIKRKESGRETQINQETENLAQPPASPPTAPGQDFEVATSERIPAETQKSTVEVPKTIRKASDVLADIKDALGEVGSIGEQKLTEKQIAARERLKKDMENFKDAAIKSGVSLVDHLTKQGFDKETIGKMMKFAPAETAKASTSSKTIKSESGEELKPHRTAERIEAEIVKALTEREALGDDIASYAVEEGMMKKQAKLGIKVATEDWESAKQMALGKKSAPEGVRPGTMVTTVSKMALERGDFDTLYELGTSKLAFDAAKEIAKGLKSFDQRMSDDPVTAMRDIMKKRSELIEKTTGKKPDTASYQVELEKVQAELKKTKEALDEYIAKTEKTAQEKVIDEIIEPKKKRELNPKEKYGAKNKIVKEDAYIKAKQELRRKLGLQLNIGFDPSLIADLTKIGAYHLEAGTRAFKPWSEKVIKDTGEWIKPHLDELWKSTKETFGKNFVEDISGKIEKAVSKGKGLPEIGIYANKLAKHFVSEGIKDRTKLIDSVHNVLKDIFPEITKRETMDAISGYGQYKLLDKSEAMANLRDLKGQMQQVAKLEDLQKKGAAQKTGIERRTPSDAERQLIKQVEEAKKKYGIQTVDKETQLKSSLDAIKTRLKNQITDLETQINTKEKLVKDKASVPYDAEATKLKARRDVLKKQYDEIFGKPGMTEVQKINMSLDAVRKSIKEYTRRIQEKDLTPSLRKKGVDSPELSKLREEREVLKKQYKDLKDAASPKRTPEQISMQKLKTRLANEIKHSEERVKNLDFTKKEKTPTPIDAELAKLKEENEIAKTTENALAKKAGVVTREEAANLVNLSKIMTDAKAEMERGGDRLKYGASKVAYENYIKDLSGENVPLKELAQNRVKEFGVTWKENKPRAVIDAVKDSAKFIADNSVAIVATLDNSFVGRQGIKTLMTHPSAWYPTFTKSFVDFAKAMGGKNTHDILMADIYSRENFLNGKYDKAKLLTKFEEQYPTLLPERVPIGGRVLKASEQAFTNAGMRMRADLFDLFEKYARENGVDTNNPKWINDFGKITNSLTARGRWGVRGEPAFVRLFMWAPKMLKANLDVLTAHGATSGLETGWGKGMAKREAATNLLKIVGITATVIAIANALKPGSAELDPRSSDFGKIKVGDTRFDITGGASSIVTLAARLLTNTKKSATTGVAMPYGIGYGADTRLDAFSNFMLNKTTPPAGVVRDLLKGENWKGEPFTWGDSLYDAFTPIILRQTIDLKDNASADRIAGVIADGLGISSTSFTKKPKEYFSDELMKAIKYGKPVPENIKKEFKENIKEGKLSFDEFMKAYKQKSKDGDPLITAAKRLSVDDSMIFYAAQNKEKRKTIAPVIMDKLLKAHKNKQIPPEKMNEYLEKIKEINQN